jgi:hypothetical protein
MNRTLDHPEEWRRLIQTALSIQKMAPWRWMREEEVFGVEDPRSGELSFVSVMGTLGEHRAVSVYRGAAALARFLELQDAPPEFLQEYPEALLEIPQLQVSFEDRDALRDWDRQLLRNLGVKPRGRGTWPQFQSFRPGFMPWHLEGEEISALAAALEQLEQVAPRAASDPAWSEGLEAGMLLIRSRRAADGGGDDWRERRQRIPLPPPPPIPLAWDPRDVNRLKGVRSAADILEVDFFLMPATIGKPSERPACIYALMAVHLPSAAVFQAEFMQAADTLEDMWGSIPGKLIQKLAQAGLRPKEVRVRSPLLMRVLPPAFREIRTPVAFKPALKRLPAAKRSLLDYFMREPPPSRG